MKMTYIKKAAVSFALTAMMAFSLTGCGDKKSAAKNSDADKVVLTVGDEKIKFSEAYFLVKLQQANTQNIISYSTGYADDWYMQDIFGNGQSFQEYFKDYYFDLLTRIGIVRDKASEFDIELTQEDKNEIEKVVDEFINANSDEALDAMLADKEVVSQVLTDYKLLEKLTAKIVDDVDTNVSDEELKKAAYKKTYDYIYISFETKDENGNSTTISAADKEEYLNQLGVIRAQTIENGDFDAAAQDAGQSVSSHSYNPGVTAAEDNLYEINNYMDDLEIGEVSEVIPLDTTGVMLGYMASDNKDELDNEELLSSTKETIISKRKLELFKETISDWKTDYKVDLDNKLWEKITMKEPLAALSSNSKK